MTDRETTPQEKHEFLSTYYTQRVKPYIEAGDSNSWREARRNMQRIQVALRLVPAHVIPYANGANLTYAAEDLADVLGKNGIAKEVLEELVESFEAHLAQWGLAVRSGNLLGLDSI